MHARTHALHMQIGRMRFARPDRVCDRRDIKLQLIIIVY